MTICAAAVLTLGLAACGGGGSDTADTMPPVVEPEPTPYEVASAAIAAAGTEAEARAAVAMAVAAGISGAQLQSLNMAVADRVMAINAAAAAAQRAALVTAAMCDDATADCLAAHDALIAALQADVDALADDETATNAQQAAAQAALDEATEDRDAVQMAINEIDRTTVAGREVGEAMDLAAGLETDRSAEAIAAAKVAIEEARQAVGDDDSYDARIAMAERYVARAEERNVVDAAVMAAEAAATGLASDSSVDAVTAAQLLVDAANMAITDAEHLTDAEKATETAKVVAAQVPVTLAKNRNDAAAKIAKDEADQKAKDDAEAKAKADAAAGKALKAALGSDPLSNLTNDAPSGTTQPTLTSAGLTVGLPNPSGAETPTPDASPRMKAGASAGSLGGWAGTHYSHTNTGTRVSNSAVVYTNRAAPRSRAATTAFASVTGYVVADRSLPNNAIATATTGNSAVAGDDFADAGTKTHTPTVAGQSVSVRGTYMGAQGTYVCPAAGTCTSGTGTEGIILSDGWTFVHDVGARTSEPDTAYLYFGWWLQKDKDGKPTSASAFFSEAGDVEGGGTFVDPATINGSATYSGHAAGKFAISDPLTGGDAGHFTADAEIKATFGAVATVPTAGVTGTIDNFRLNDGSEDPGWSVSLNRAGWDTGTAGAFASTAANNTNTTAEATVWSIDGNSAGETGSWNGQMHDEALAPTAVNDGSNVPTSVVGVFQSHFGSTHTMVGAFGATKD